MRYSVARLAYSFTEPWQQDIFLQGLCDMGFDAFMDDRAYIPTDTLQQHRSEIETFIAQSEYVELLALDDCPDEDWNATWEAEHPTEQLPMDVVIVPHCAFGAGHHETTSMMIDALLETNRCFHNVLDMGCGTGVLGIMAKKCGAEEVTAVDIDEQSVNNTLENAERNKVQLHILQADTPPVGDYDLILANIHRNILISQMEDYVRFLKKGGELWISGFYETDVPALITVAQNHGLTHITTRQRGEWRMIQFTK